MGTAIGGPDQGVGYRLLTILRTEHLARHDLHAAAAVHAAGNAADTLAVAVYGSDRTGHVGAVTRRGLAEAVPIVPVQGTGSRRGEVGSVAQLRIGIERIDPHVGFEIGVIVLHRLVQHGDHDALVARADLPRIEEADIGACLRAVQRARVVIVPLLVQTRIVAGSPIDPHAAGIGRRKKTAARRTHRRTHVLDPGDGLRAAQGAGRTAQIDLRIESGHVPEVQSGRTQVGLERFVAEHAGEAPRPDLVERKVNRLHARAGALAAGDTLLDPLHRGRGDLNGQHTGRGPFGNIQNLLVAGGAADSRTGRLIEILGAGNQRDEDSRHR